MITCLPMYSFLFIFLLVYLFMYLFFFLRIASQQANITCFCFEAFMSDIVRLQFTVVLLAQRVSVLHAHPGDPGAVAVPHFFFVSCYYCVYIFTWIATCMRISGARI